MSGELSDQERTLILQDAEGRRGDFHRALVELEQAIARDATGHLDEWIQEVVSSLEQMLEAIDEHIQLTERPGGLHDEVRGAAPRLSSRIKRLQREHPILRARVEELVALMDKPGIGDRWPLDEARNDIQRLLRMVARHRQSAADLIWEAYHLDIGGVE
ncbi:MAG: hypothetical protein AB1551_03650 [Actinomycetota bacterium]